MSTLLATTIPTFYHIKGYAPEINRIVPRSYNGDYLHFSEVSRPHFVNNIMHYFSEVTYERMGVMHGEYVLHNGMMLIDTEGMHFKANMAWEDRWGANEAYDYICNSESFHSYKKEIIENWERLPVVESPIVISHPYPNAYFHWMLETVTKNRFFDGHPQSPNLVPAMYLKHFFQKDLLARTSAGRTLIIQQENIVRVRNPILSHEIMSENGVFWLRETLKIPLKNQQKKKKIYLRRSQGNSRERLGGGIHETVEFIMFLKEYEFEVIDFSDQNLTIEEQVRILDDACIILAPHGAALANIAYLNPPLRVIEIIGARTPRGMFMHLASMLKFHYFGIYSPDVDEDRNVIVNMDELRDVMKECLKT